MKVVLYGPPNVGKNTFKSVLLGKEASEGETSFGSGESLDEDASRREEMEGELIQVGEYLLNLLTLPGGEKFHNARVKAFSKEVIGCLLFYDASDPSSAYHLMEMAEEELIDTRYLHRLISVVVLGTITRKESFDAVWIADKLKEKLSAVISSNWGYEVPHLLISSTDREDVLLSFWLAATLIPTRKVPEEVLEEYSATKFFEKIKREKRKEAKKERRSLQRPRRRPQRKRSPRKKDAPSESASVPKPPPPPKKEAKPQKQEKAPEPPASAGIPSEEPQEAEEKGGFSILSTDKPLIPQPGAKIEAQDSVMGYPLFLLPSTSDIWRIPQRFVEKFAEIQSSVVCRIKGEKIFLAFFPRKERTTEILTNKIKLLVFFHDMIETKERLKKMAISSKNQHFLLVRRGTGLILLETEGPPSKELEDLFNVSS